ncbi:hypothetical protein QUF63_15190 [Anaerolineales bacterium HSG25]|nr:hypothetical protein [Anaerolineales bacterium HSG25]
MVDTAFPEIKVITTELEHAIIGRDLLNQFHLELDGRAQRVTIRGYG